MNNLPWQVAKSNHALVVDNKGCQVVDLSYFHATGYGHNADEIAQFLVSRANDLLNKEALEKHEQPVGVVE